MSNISTEEEKSFPLSPSDENTMKPPATDWIRVTLLYHYSKEFHALYGKYESWHRRSLHRFIEAINFVQLQAGPLFPAGISTMLDFHRVLELTELARKAGKHIPQLQALYELKDFWIRFVELASAMTNLIWKTEDSENCSLLVPIAPFVENRDVCVSKLKDLKVKLDREIKEDFNFDEFYELRANKTILKPEVSVGNNNLRGLTQYIPHLIHLCMEITAYADRMNAL